MIETNFVEWMKIKKSKKISENHDPFTNLQQKQGDTIYFGVHDLSRFYKAQGKLPLLDLASIEDKCGQIVNGDPIEQTVATAVNKSPYQYGYHKLEKTKTKTDGNGKTIVSIPVSHLQNISHLVHGNNSANVWLVVDVNTKYQQLLMKEIRRKEIEKINNPQSIENLSNPQRYQLSPEGSQTAQQTPNDMNQETGQISQINKQRNPDQEIYPNDFPKSGIQNPSEIDSNNYPVIAQQPQQSFLQPKFRMVNKEVFPVNPNVQLSHFNPTIVNYDRLWKRHGDIKRYSYVN